MNKLKVLYIEDDDVDARVMREAFKDLSTVDVEIAPNLTTAHDIGNADVVLLDLMLPESLGVDTVRKCRAGFPDKPILVLTHVDNPRVQADCIAAGANYYFRKGEQDVAVLLRAMEAALIAQANRMAATDELEHTKKYAVPIEVLLSEMLERIRVLQEQLKG